MPIASHPTARIFAEIQAEYRALVRQMTSLSVRQLSQELPGLGTPVAVLIHITAWQANALTIARQQARPDAPALDPDQSVGLLLGLDTERFNADVRATHADWLIDRALHWYNEVHFEIMAALAVLPFDRLLGGGGPYSARRWYSGPCITHSRGHREEVAQLLRLT